MRGVEGQMAIHGKIYKEEQEEEQDCGENRRGEENVMERYKEEKDVKKMRGKGTFRTRVEKFAKRRDEQN